MGGGQADAGKWGRHRNHTLAAGPGGKVLCSIFAADRSRGGSGAGPEGVASAGEELRAGADEPFPDLRAGKAKRR